MGKVILVRYKKNNKFYAIKIIAKQNIIEKNQLKNTKMEK